MRRFSGYLLDYAIEVFRRYAQCVCIEINIVLFGIVLGDEFEEIECYEVAFTYIRCSIAGAAFLLEHDVAQFEAEAFVIEF